jgi:hypothetical protein
MILATALVGSNGAWSLDITPGGFTNVLSVQAMGRVNDATQGNQVLLAMQERSQQ